MNLIDTLSGRLVLRTDADFERARIDRVFNHRRPDRTPIAVLEAAHADDVVSGVRLARQRGWRVSVRAGGHSWAAWSVRDDVLLIDLAGLNGIEVDDDTGVVKVGPATRGGTDLDPELERHGLFFNGGHCPTVGVGGFLLQGGMGWNCRGWGWAAESVVAIDVVTADGELIRADPEQNADLFWAARGAGPGFFGIVTAFYLQARPRFKALHQSTFVYPLDVTAQVLTWLHDIHTTISPTVELVAVSIVAPLPDDVPAHVSEAVLVVHAVAFDDTRADAERALAPLTGCPVVDRALVREHALPTTLAAERTEQVRANPEGHRYAVDNAWITGTAADVVPRLLDAFTTMPTAKTFTLWFSMGPLRPLPDMALSLQTEIYLASYVIWEDPQDDARCRGWLADRMAALEPVTAGQYLGDSDLATRAVRFMAPENFARLEQIRHHRDPDNLFVSYLAAPTHPINTNHWQ